MTTTNLQLAEITESQANKYATHNNALVELDDIIAGTLVKELTSDADYTLLTTGSPAEWQRAVIKITDTTPNLTAARNIIVPNNEKVYIAYNATGTYNLTFKTSAGTGVSVPPGKAALVYSDGTNVEPANNYAAALSLGALLMAGNVDLDGNDLIIDADGDSYLHASADDVIDLVIAGNTLLSYQVDVVEQKNGTNAQESRVYNEYSAADDYHRFTVKSVAATLSALSGASVTESALIPAGAFLIGVTTRIDVALGTGNGTTGYQVGDGVDPDLWGDITGTAIGTASHSVDFTAAGAAGVLFTTAQDVVLTAVGGNFDATGDIKIVAHYLITEAD